MTISNSLQLTLNSVFTFILQFFIFALIPFIWWKVTKPNERFFTWLGFKKAKFNNKIFPLVIIIIIWFICYNFDPEMFIDMTVVEESDALVSNIFTGLGVYAIIPAFIQALFVQGVTEELLFRGFLAKRLINKFDFNMGNLIQGCLFGSMHVALFLVAGINIGALGFILMFLTTAIPALLLTYLNEKLFDGSIIPSILVHGLGNFMSYMIVAFNLL